jgi:hypothetical protein
MELKHVQALEQLHLHLLNARLRKRKTLTIKPEDFVRYEQAIKAALPPFDFRAHGFASADTSGETIGTIPDVREFAIATKVENAARDVGTVSNVFASTQEVEVNWNSGRKTKEHCENH